MSTRRIPSRQHGRTRDLNTKSMHRRLLRVALKGLVYGATSSLGATAISVVVSWLPIR